MSSAVYLRAYAGICAYYLDVLSAVSHAYKNLVKTSSRCKSAERRAEWNLAASRKTCRDAHHICFGDTNVEKSIGVRLLERRCLDAVHEVCFDYDYLIVCLCFFYQRVAIYLSHFQIILHITRPPFRRIRAIGLL